MSEIKNFYKEYEDMFEEYLENTIGNLKYKNEKYKKLYQEYNDLLSKNKNLNWILEGQVEGRNLNNYECKMLSKLVQIFYDMKEIEAKELFFLGGNEAYFYFKNVGILKQKLLWRVVVQYLILCIKQAMNLYYRTYSKAQITKFVL